MYMYSDQTALGNPLMELCHIGNNLLKAFYQVSKKFKDLEAAVWFSSIIPYIIP